MTNIWIVFAEKNVSSICIAKATKATHIFCYKSSFGSICIAKATKATHIFVAKASMYLKIT